MSIDLKTIILFYLFLKFKKKIRVYQMKSVWIINLVLNLCLSIPIENTIITLTFAKEINLYQGFV